MDGVIEVLNVRFGDWLKKQLAERGMSQAAFIAASGLPRSTVTGWLRPDGFSPQRHQLAAIARGLKTSLIEVEAAFDGDSGSRSTVARIPILNRPGQFHELPRLIPILGKVSASRIGSHEQGSGGVGMDSGHQFILVCEGDCMEPEYHDGEHVLFETTTDVRDGDDCGFYLSGSDERTTFKRVHLDKRDPSVFVLRCLNKAKYKAEIRVKRDDVVRVGKAVWIMRAVKR